LNHFRDLLRAQCNHPVGLVWFKKEILPITLWNAHKKNHFPLRYLTTPQNVSTFVSTNPTSWLKKQTIPRSFNKMSYQTPNRLTTGMKLAWEEEQRLPPKDSMARLRCSTHTWIDDYFHDSEFKEDLTKLEWLHLPEPLSSSPVSSTDLRIRFDEYVGTESRSGLLLRCISGYECPLTGVRSIHAILVILNRLYLQNLGGVSLTLSKYVMIIPVILVILWQSSSAQSHFHK